MTQSDALAASWYEKAAEANHANACYNYAVCLEKGKGVDADRAAARGYFRRAAIFGHVQARKVLKESYHEFV